MALCCALYDTAIGDVTLEATDKAVTGLKFGAYAFPGATQAENVVLYDAIMELNQFFFGQRKSFDIKLDFQSCSDEAKRVYEYVLRIPFGELVPYSKACADLGVELHFLQQILVDNPLPIFIPDHRVVGENLTLGVYSGELKLKKDLILFERKNRDKNFSVNQNYSDD